MNDSLLAERPLLGYPDAHVELHVKGRVYNVKIVDPVGTVLWCPVTRKDAADMYFHPFVYGYSYRTDRVEETYDEDGA